MWTWILMSFSPFPFNSTYLLVKSTKEKQNQQSYGIKSAVPHTLTSSTLVFTLSCAYYDSTIDDIGYIWKSWKDFSDYCEEHKCSTQFVELIH